MERVTPRVHDLVRIVNGGWAVVRRERVPGGIPIGVRGTTRAQRRASVIDANSIASVVTPEEAAQRDAPRAHRVFDALAKAQAAASSLGFVLGATGACGYELVTGEPALHDQSDLDVIVRTGFDDARLQQLAAALGDADVRIDAEVLRDDGCGAALEEIVRGGSFLVKTPDGPRLQ